MSPPIRPYSHKGISSWFDPVTGYGFLTRGEGTQDIFVHMETLRREGILPIQAGQRLRVRIGDSAKGPQVAEIERPAG